MNFTLEVKHNLTAQMRGLRINFLVHHSLKTQVFSKKQFQSEGVFAVSSQMFTLSRDMPSLFFPLPAAGKMKLLSQAGLFHRGLLRLCIAALCIQLVSSGNQSSRGQTGGCQTPPDQPRSPGELIMAPGQQPARPERVQFKGKPERA